MAQGSKKGGNRAVSQPRKGAPKKPHKNIALSARKQMSSNLTKIIEKDCLEKTQRDKVKMLLVKADSTKAAKAKAMRKKILEGKKPVAELEKLIQESEEKNENDDDSSQKDNEEDEKVE